MHVEVFKVNASPESDTNGTPSDSSDGDEKPLVCEFDRTVLSLKRDHAT